MISEVDIRDWDRAYQIIDDADTVALENGKDSPFLYSDYLFLVELIEKQKKEAKKVPSLFWKMWGGKYE